ncbi:unnamed protein product [Prunus armeniaca]
MEDEKPKRINKPGWSIKGLSYALQIWVYELIAELGIPPLRYCKRIEELALVPRICRWESTDKVPEFRKLIAYIFQSKQCTSHADARKTRDAGEERNKTEDAGEESQKTEDAGEERNKIEDAGEESEKTEDAGEESDKTEDGGVAESREQCVQN